MLAILVLIEIGFACALLVTLNDSALCHVHVICGCGESHNLCHPCLEIASGKLVVISYDPIFPSSHQHQRNHIGLQLGSAPNDTSSWLQPLIFVPKL
jgi:hypothetical protein